MYFLAFCSSVVPLALAGLLAKTKKANSPKPKTTIGVGAAVGYDIGYECKIRNGALSYIDWGTKESPQPEECMCTIKGQSYKCQKEKRHTKCGKGETPNYIEGTDCTPECKIKNSLGWINWETKESPQPEECMCTIKGKTHICRKEKYHTQCLKGPIDGTNCTPACDAEFPALEDGEECFCGPSETDYAVCKEGNNRCDAGKKLCATAEAGKPTAPGKKNNKAK